MERLHLENQWVLVTGASGGLGREMARILAKQYRANVVLTARRKPLLEQLRDELVADGVQVDVVDADMTVPADLDRLFDVAKQRPLAGAILNAGVTYFGRFEKQDAASVAAILATNVASVVELSRRLVPLFLARTATDTHAPALMLVSSLAGFQPMPYQALYGGTKALVTSFGIALQRELAGRPLSVTVFCPGGIATDMIEKSAMGRKFKRGHAMVMDADICASRALAAMIRRKKVVVPGILNNLSAWICAISPRAWSTWIVEREYRDALDP